MTIIEQTWKRFPGEPISQDTLIDLLPAWLEGDKLRLANQLFRRAAVSSRHMAVPPAEMVSLGRTFAQKNEQYKRVIREEISALAETIRASISAEERSSIAMLVTASCTGFQIPAMDALLIQALDLPCDVRRVNLTEHGCAGGAASIGLAHEWLSSARPDKRALVVCAELCSLTFQPEDTSSENLVGAAIFGDGAAAVLLAGSALAPPKRSSPVFRIRDTYREFFPATEHFMGFDVNDAGFKLKLSQDIIPFSYRAFPAFFKRACDRWEIAGPEIFKLGSVHPGGRRILEILEDEVGISAEVTRTSWECLRRYGNMSSTSVLVTLDRLITDHQAVEHDALGLISAFGPGFGAELSLLEVAA